MKNIEYLSTSIFFLLMSQFSYSQVLTVDDTMTPEALVRDIFLGGGVSVSNVKFTGTLEAIGNFETDAIGELDLGFKNGIILTNGSAYNAIGPNDNLSISQDNGDKGDKDLNKYAGINTLDASVLEFDFVPSTDTVVFRYIFGSEEYPEFVGSNFNDVFGFFISGPGIVGKKNIALIPGTSMPVTINNVNLLNNTLYYHNNVPGLTVQYDGYTVPLVAWSAVTPCETYHIKLAIADGSDRIYDSGVFLEGNSFKSANAVFITAKFSTPDKIVMEGCGKGTIIMNRTDNLGKKLTVPIVIGGAAINGVDYLKIPDSMTLSIGEASSSIDIFPIADGILEGNQSVSVRLPNYLSCLTDQDSVGFLISEYDSVKAVISRDTTVFKGESVNLDFLANGGSRFYTYEWSSGEKNVRSINVQPPITTTYFATVEDSCSLIAFSDSVTVTVLEKINPDNEIFFSIPNAFSPDGNNENESFNGSGKGIKTYNLKIYNRWGAFIFQTDDLDIGWKGDKNSVGMYIYIATVLDINDNLKTYTGTVALIR